MSVIGGLQKSFSEFLLIIRNWLFIKYNLHVLCLLGPNKCLFYICKRSVLSLSALSSQHFIKQVLHPVIFATFTNDGVWSSYGLRGITGQYLGSFLSQLQSKVSCMAASIPWIFAASLPYSFFISAVLLSPGRSEGGRLLRQETLCKSWSARTYKSCCSASICCCFST